MGGKRGRSGPLRAGVIGLGRIGNLFDSDPKRKGVWTHAGAYEACAATELAGGADPDPMARRRFRAMRKAAFVYDSAEALMEARRPEIVSVCTLPERHADDVATAARMGAKAIFCEKPLAVSLAEGRRAIAACRKAGALLAVNHVRRWERVYVEARKAIREGAVGKPLTAFGVYSDNVYKVGSHLFDALNYLIGPIEAVQGMEAPGGDPGDPAVGGVLLFAGGARGAAVCTGRRDDLIFELDVVGAEGRISLRDNGAWGERSVFRESERYGGYRELTGTTRFEGAADDPRFVAAVESLVGALKGGPLVCSGEDGFHSLAVAEALTRSVRNGGARTAVEMP